MFPLVHCIKQKKIGNISPWQYLAKKLNLLLDIFFVIKTSSSMSITPRILKTIFSQWPKKITLNKTVLVIFFFVKWPHLSIE